MRHLILAWILGGAAFILSGCTHFTGGAHIELSEPGSVDTFSGLLPSKESNAPAQGLHYVFIIHGMGATDRNYDQQLLDAIAKQGYTRGPEGSFVDVALPHPIRVTGEAFTCADNPDSPPCTYATFGKYRVDRFVHKQNPDLKVIVFTYFWNDAMALVQDEFLRKDHNTPTGAWINTQLKHDLIDDGFGDATAYLGAAGGLARLGIAGPCVPC
jgi:hypothetical protein